MIFKKGDRVKFLNDVGGGVITRVISEKQVLVETDDGFDIPVLVNEIVFSGDAQEKKEMEEKRALEPLQVTTSKGKEADDVDIPVEVNFSPSHEGKKVMNWKFYLGFVRVGESKKHFSTDMYLINDSEYQVFYHLFKYTSGQYLPLSSGLLEEDTKISIGRIKPDDLKPNDEIMVQAIALSKGEFEKYPPVDHVFSGVSGLDNRANFGMNDFFDEDAWIIDLLEKAVEIKVQELKEMIEQSPVMIKDSRTEGASRKIVATDYSSDLEEVDLHIEELVEDHTRMSPGEILDLQISRFSIAMEGAIRGKTKRIVFIHGVGNGKLKHELRKELDSKYKQYKYQDASFAEYGFGATMVIIRK